MPFGMEVIRETLACLEGLIGPIHEYKDCLINDKLELVMEIIKKASGKYVELVAEIYRKLQVIKDDIFVLKMKVACVPICECTSRLKLSAPKAFNGVQSPKELGNNFWVIEQFFSLAKIDMGKQVDITVTYLICDAKLWRRTIIKDEFNDG